MAYNRIAGFIVCIYRPEFYINWKHTILEMGPVSVFRRGDEAPTLLGLLEGVVIANRVGAYIPPP
jgi:hypothetical protein